jgi:hypothetical protein
MTAKNLKTGQNMADMNKLLELLRSGAQGASNGIASNVSGNVDLLNSGLGLLGVPVSNAPIMGSQWMRDKGLTAEPQNRMAGLLGEGVGMAAPWALAAKAPEIAGGLLKGAENLAAPARLNKQAGLFIGQNAKTWNSDAATKAKAMAESGVDPRQIWKETGTWKGPDGMWRQEIPDNTATLNKLSDSAVDYMTGPGPATYPAKASQAINHKPLFDAYPDFKSIDTSYSNTVPASGEMRLWNGKPTILFGAKHEGGKFANEAVSKSTLTHELQHGIQAKEGFARGGSPENFGQQKDAELARDALSWANELKRKASEMKGADTSAIDMAVRKEYESIGASDMIPKIEARQLAMQPYVMYPEKYPSGGVKDLHELVNLYGLDKAVTPAKDYDLYKRLAGEAEARATQARIPLGATERRALFPLDSYDVPLDQLIIRGLLGQ